MKKAITLILFIISNVIASNAQIQEKQAEIDSSFRSLKYAILKRSDIVDNYTDELEKYRFTNKILSLVKEKNAKLSKDAKLTLPTDSVRINNLYHQNITLEKLLGQLVSQTANSKKIKSNKKFISLIMQIEGAQNRFLFQKKDYNKICLKHERKDLLFGKIEIDPILKVEF